MRHEAVPRADGATSVGATKPILGAQITGINRDAESVPDADTFGPYLRIYLLPIVIRERTGLHAHHIINRPIPELTRHFRYGWRWFSYPH